MNEQEIAEWVDTAAEKLLKEKTLNLGDLSIADRQEIIDRIRAKSTEMRRFADNGGEMRDTSDEYIEKYSKAMNALLGLAWRIDPGILEEQGTQVINALTK
jgi:hypothetical protein